MIQKNDSLSLSQLNLRIKSALQSSFAEPVWVVAEISELRVNNSGHCYLELIEKDNETENLLAKIKATIWAYTFRMLSPYFETTTGYALTAGLKVLIYAQPEFHEVYGINLIIKDIDPSYTLGELARKRQEIIRKLQAEGVIDMNRNLPFPEVPQRIAVISSETAAGYGDFMDTLINNPAGYKFSVQLFPSLMQGERAAESIIEALENIYSRENDFDLVVIIRGGGAQSDLECFNNYNLVYHITQFPLPILSGIGHERDETITDIVAHTSLKTPTAVSEFLIDRLSDFERLLEDYGRELASLVSGRISEEKEVLSSLSQNTVYLLHESLLNERSLLINASRNLGSLTGQFKRRKDDAFRNYLYRISAHHQNAVKSANSNIQTSEKNLLRNIRIYFNSRSDRLADFEKSNDHLSPEKVLARGYSISSSDGKLIKDSRDLKEGKILTTRYFKGESKSIIREIKK
ncbi:MAG: exodeoxyribonuclease VII large subunit [Bacteroidales bacterium]|nr:exodeoxyribonuclease VII large subunit [Bacteroidales bacterium]